MSDDLLSLLDRPQPGRNLPEYTVGELSTGVKKTLEQAFGRVRVRGEICQPKLHSSGHFYLSLKDSDAVIDAVCWKGSFAKLAFRPADGMDVVITGRVTTYGKSSKYQLIAEEIALAGQGALLQLLEARRKQLAAEGLFDAERKRPLPYLPRRIAVVTSPTGAVIRDILHRLEDRFPVHVLLWPVPVQGETAAMQIAGAITGLNALTGDDAPDLIIVARGGGSLEDLMAFNEEIVVRAAAASRIPLISAVGHETDTTLIDYAADVRAPTPTAAAELAVPVRRDLLAMLAEQERRLAQLLQATHERANLRLTSAVRGLGQGARLLEGHAQRTDDLGERLGNAQRQLINRRHNGLEVAAARLTHPRALLRLNGERLQALSARLPRTHAQIIERRANRLAQVSAVLEGHSLQKLLARGFALVKRNGQPVTKAAMLNNGDRIELLLADGSKAARVED